MESSALKKMKGILLIIIVVGLAIVSLKCTLKCLKSKLDTYLLPNYNFKNDNTGNKITVLTSICFWIAILLIYLIFMTIISRIIDGKPLPIKGGDSIRIKLLNRIINNTLGHSLVFIFSFAYFLFNKVQSVEQLNDAFMIGTSWFVFRVLYVITYFISLDIKVPTLRVFGLSQSAYISIYFITLNLGIQKLTWLYN